MNAWKPIIAALVIFAAGVITGGLTTRLAAPQRSRPPQNLPAPLGGRAGRPELLDRMQRELSLTAIQRERIDVVIRDSQERTRQLWESIAPQAHAEHKRIRERIREELRHGKNIFGAVEQGFGKAFRTILDANVTNAAAAAVLLMYGTGPIKGFAVSLLIGIVTTLFTAVFVCRLFFDAYLRRLEDAGRSTISI